MNNEYTILTVEILLNYLKLNEKRKTRCFAHPQEKLHLFGPTERYRWLSLEITNIEHSFVFLCTNVPR